MIENDLLNGMSVLVHAPKNYGKQYFFEELKKNQLFKNVIFVDIPKDNTGNLDFQKLWLMIANEVPGCRKRQCSSKEQFIDNVSSMIKRCQLNLTIKSNLQNVRNSAAFVNLFQEIKLKQWAAIVENFRLLILDDFSLYYFEYDAIENRSIFDFLSRYILGMNEDRELLLDVLLTLKLPESLCNDIGLIISEISGGNDGLIIQLVKEIKRGWIINDAINFKIEAINFLIHSNQIDHLRKLLLIDDKRYEKLLRKYKNKRLIDPGNNDLIRELHTSGIILMLNSIYAIRCSGIISNLVDNLYLKRLIIFLHGLGGNRFTWKYFKKIIEQDKELLADFSVAYYIYPTSIVNASYFFFKKIPSIEMLAKGLKTEIDNKYADYDDISLVCHSLGGLVAKQYLIDEFDLPEIKISSVHVKRMLTFATPHNGSSLANVGKQLFNWNYQLKQLCKNSDYITTLNSKWERLEISNKLKVKFIIAALDPVVEPKSSEGNHPDQSYTSIDTNHFSIIRPENSESLQYVIFKEFLKFEY